VFSFICFALSFEVSNQQVAGGRAIAYGQVPPANGDCYIISAQYKTRPSGGRGDVFAAAMGKTIGGFGYPWTALGYVRGSYDLDHYENSSLDQVNIDADGAVVAWAFVALGEFCDMDGQEGFQNGTTDFIINKFDAPLGAPYTQRCGVQNDPITNLQSYYSSVQSNLGVFNTTCMIFPSDTNVDRNGRRVSRYQYKCDVRVDYTLLWEQNPVKVRSCTDDKRKVGLLVNVVGSAFDIDVSVDANLNTRSQFAPDADSISFAGGKLQFAWDNYFIKTSSFGASSGAERGRVTYGYLRAGESTATYKGAQRVEQVIFSFSTPKSENKNFYYWDPAITVGAVSVTPLVGLVFAILSIIFLF